jgi:cystathionine gamma-synthase
MSTRDLLLDPRWRAEELGRPLPDSIHAISVALPRWQDVVGYEEKRPEVMDRLRCGYPRFVVHPLVQELARQLAEGQACLPFPSLRCAELAAEFVRRTAEQPAQVTPGKGVFGVATNDAGLAALRAFWQHTGLILPSRQAEALLARRPAPTGGPEARQALRQQLAGLYDCAEDDVFLTPTGMAAQFAALRAVQRRTPGAPTAQLGFPYVDTLKLQQKSGAGVTLFHHLDTLTEDLRALLERQHLAACFCEIPGNPLLGSADVRQLSLPLKAKGVPLVADDVVATAVNVDLSGCADLIATSLTKYVAGTCDVMGGAVICNPHSPFHAELRAALVVDHEELLWSEDAIALEACARDFPERMQRHNANGLFIAERLRAHPAIEKVWYPKWESSHAYESVRRPDGGWGSLVTFLPHDAETASPRIYDRLAVCKGPSLGTVFTLACPFTLLAHYTELEWAESCGVSRHLIRLSVGLEDPQELWQRIERALNGEGRP